MCLVVIYSKIVSYVLFVFVFKQRTAYELRISDWSSDVCSSDLAADRIERIVDPNAQIFARRFAVRRSLPGIANVAPAQHDPERWCSVAHAVVIGHEEIGRESCRERVCP